ncbi:hypothetical protein [Ruegeria sp.]|nr:hypothetical protein [Ruegeria sp.]
MIPEQLAAVHPTDYGGLEYRTDAPVLQPGSVDAQHIRAHIG